MRLPRVEDIERRIPAPEDFRSQVRGPETTSRVGLALGIAFGICFLTGLWSHFQYTSPGWLPIGPSPASFYRVTQGLHIISGVAAIPLLLVKLWSVYPRLFLRPPRDRRALVVDVLERGSIAVLVAAGIFQLSIGPLNIVQWYPWEFSFRVTHYAVAWVAIGALLVHIAVKLPLIREALGAPLEPAGELEPEPDIELDPVVIPDGVEHVGQDSNQEEAGEDPAPPDPDAPGRRAVLAGTFGATGLAVLLTAGQSVPFLRKVSVFGVRDGDGPQDLPINRTAKAAGSTAEAMSPDFALEIRSGDQTRTLTRADLSALPQQTHRLPIACVEGWSRSAEWTGVPVRDLLDLIGAPAASKVFVTSMQTKGAFGKSELPADFVADSRTLLALKLNGEALSIDHGYPCRIIAPNRPGVLQTKWVKGLEVKA